MFNSDHVEPFRCELDTNDTKFKVFGGVSYAIHAAKVTCWGRFLILPPTPFLLVFYPPSPPLQHDMLMLCLATLCFTMSANVVHHTAQKHMPVQAGVEGRHQAHSLSHTPHH